MILRRPIVIELLRIENENDGLQTKIIEIPKKAKAILVNQIDNDYLSDNNELMQTELTIRLPKYHIENTKIDTLKYQNKKYKITQATFYEHYCNLSCEEVIIDE